LCGAESALYFESAMVLPWVGVVCCVGLLFVVERSLSCSVVKEGAKLLLTLSGDCCGGEGVSSFEELLR
jgi:hypothetical protein